MQSVFEEVAFSKIWQSANCWKASAKCVSWEVGVTSEHFLYIDMVEVNTIMLEPVNTEYRQDTTHQQTECSWEPFITWIT